KIFDIGRTTRTSIYALMDIIQEEKVEQLALLREKADELDNGNGALMRIFPLYAFLQHQPLDTWLEYIWLHSALTHGHVRSAYCCFLYLRFCSFIADGHNKENALRNARGETEDLLQATQASAKEWEVLQKILTADFANLARAQVQGSGYVVHCLEAALWSLFNADSYRTTVLQAVNLGQDTDTTACVAGAPAALLYGAEAIPANWLATLARREDIIGLGARLHAAFSR
ncbi:MAG: ADP-ribosylglycohydrolase family protein, partial [Bacteroidota bacterium]